jgi:hypothetical protein
MKKEEWGPLVWAMLHLLSMDSDRKDIGALWNRVLLSTQHAIPCGVCREHMRLHLRTHRLPYFPIKDTGAGFQQRVARFLHEFHNSVNTRLGKELVTYESCVEHYKVGTRGERLTEVLRLFQTLSDGWAPDDHMRANPAIFTEWKAAMRTLYAMIQAGPY